MEMGTKPSNNKATWKHLLHKVPFKDVVSFYILMDRVYEFIKNQGYICDSQTHELFIETHIVPLLNYPIIRVLLSFLFALETIITPEKKKEIFDKQCIYIDNRADWRELVDKKQYNAIMKHIDSIAGKMHYKRQLIDENGKFYLYNKSLNWHRSGSIISKNDFCADSPEDCFVRYVFDSKLEYPFVFTNDYNTHLVYIDNNLQSLLERLDSCSEDFIQSLAVTASCNNISFVPFYNLSHLLHTCGSRINGYNYAMHVPVQKEYDESPLMVKLDKYFRNQTIGAHI